MSDKADLLAGGGLSEPLRTLLLKTPDGVRLLQRAARLKQDGNLTRNQIVAIGKMDQARLCADFMAERVMSTIGRRDFDEHGHEWVSDIFMDALAV